ncbi:MAG TPA: ribose 5-phosphate isomerase B [Planctomycetes bacterium]|nr:ribose 5-phosphate isomerase B [Planctomycetota bacterium]HIN81051.1 ribose 5-phosphate isomerase B [Planctomycetota bacterium]
MILDGSIASLGEGARFTPLARDRFGEYLRRGPPLPPRPPAELGVVEENRGPTRGGSVGGEDSPAGESWTPSAIAVGADHGGFQLKKEIVAELQRKGITILDEGTDSEESCDYPIFARRVAERVSTGEADIGIVIDGAGIGSTMVANKIPGVRAANCLDERLASNAREHNHANLLCLGSGWVDGEVALSIIEAFLSTPPGSGRHARRVQLFPEMAPKGEVR